MNIDVLVQWALPFSLTLVMFGLGLGLAVRDFRRLALAPRPVLLGLFAQFVVLPMLALAVAAALGLSPVLAAGLVILALCPGGITSNMFSWFARGDVALSISLTAVISLAAPFSVPLLAAVLVPLVSGKEAEFRLDPFQTWATLMSLTVVPVILGMILRRVRPLLAGSMERWVGPASIVIMFLIIAGIVYQNREEMPGFLAAVGGAVVLLNVLAFGSGWLVARLGRLPARQQATIGIEVGIQNGSMAMLITGLLLANPQMTVVPAMYGLLMFPIGAAFVALVRRTLIPATDPSGA